MIRASMRHARGFARMLALIALAAPNAVADDRFAGRPLTEVLAELQAAGLSLVYSSALVRPEMVVAGEPSSSDPREALREILAPFGLSLAESPGDRLVIVHAQDRSAPVGGEIRGVIQAERAGESVAGVIVRVPGTSWQEALTGTGRFSLPDLPAGEYTLETESPRFLPQRLDNVVVRAGGVTRLRITLAPNRAFREEIVVTPGGHEISSDQPEHRLYMGREELAQIPQIADDLYRAVQRTPGAATGDYSAAFSIRGGDQDEVLVLLDGLELYEPFHLKDFQNAFSIVDAGAVAGAELLTGGFPVEYGDRMSGVVDISMPTPSSPTVSSVELGTINARVLSAGSFDRGRGQWLFSGRGWYPHLMLEAVGAVSEEITSDYYDVIARVGHEIGAHSYLSAGALLAYDKLSFLAEDEQDTERVAASYESHHLWGNLRTQWSDALFSQTVLSAGRVGRDRTGGVVDVEEGTLAVYDDRTFSFLGLKQDWTLQLSPDHMLKWGIDAKSQQAEYDYQRVSGEPGDAAAGGGTPPVDASVVILQPEGYSYGVYVGDRFRLGGVLVAELGLRWDHQTWLDDSQLSPRVNLSYSPEPRTTLRAAWGRFHQSQRLNELQVEDGVSTFYPAQRAVHWLASVEHRFAGGLTLGIEGYEKQLSDLRPRYENLFNPIELFPEAQEDRVLVAPERGSARGVELVLKHATSRGVAWRGSYAISRAEDVIDGEAVPRSWDQRHALAVGVNIALPRRWSLDLAGTYHSGWPATAVSGQTVDGPDGPEVELIYGPRNGERYPDYVRLDVRAAKRFPVRDGEITVMLEVLNLTDRANVCCTEDVVTTVREDGSVEVTPEHLTWLPTVPSLAVRWQF
jgi:outer membrane receptor protein involved in Fe transport